MTLALQLRNHQSMWFEERNQLTLTKVKIKEVDFKNWWTLLWKNNWWA